MMMTMIMMMMMTRPVCRRRGGADVACQRALIADTIKRPPQAARTDAGGTGAARAGGSGRSAVTVAEEPGTEHRESGAGRRESGPGRAAAGRITDGPVDMRQPSPRANTTACTSRAPARCRRAFAHQYLIRSTATTRRLEAACVSRRRRHCAPYRQRATYRHLRTSRRCFARGRYFRRYRHKFGRCDNTQKRSRQPDCPRVVSIARPLTGDTDAADTGTLSVRLSVCHAHGIALKRLDRSSLNQRFVVARVSGFSDAEVLDELPMGHRPPGLGARYTRVSQIGDFPPAYRCISEMLQDRDRGTLDANKKSYVI